MIEKDFDTGTWISRTLSKRWTRKGNDGKKGGMYAPQLTSQRELVTKLDPEPLYDYLTKHGAVDQQILEEAKGQESPIERNLCLLKHIEHNGRGAVNLLVNALRQSGQHHLANLLDEGQRIKALSGSGYLSKKRKKGQLSLQILVDALKLPPQESTSIQNVQLPCRDWLSQEDIRNRLSVLLYESDPRHPVEQFEVAEPTIFEEEEKSSSCCLCGCFARMFSSSKDKKSSKKGEKSEDKNQNQSNGAPHTEQPGNGVEFSSLQNMPSKQQHINGNANSGDKPQKGQKYLVISEGEDEDYDNMDKEIVKSTSSPDIQLEVENLKNLSDSFEQKCVTFYDLLEDESNPTYTQLLKYFEQDRGVLVLETNCEDGFVIVSICPKKDQLEQLQKDRENGKLVKDLENCIVSDDILNMIGAEGIKLTTDLSQEEYDQALKEMS